MSVEQFVTVRNPVSAQIEVKRSRFLCDLVPLREAVLGASVGTGDAGDAPESGDRENADPENIEAARERRARAVVDAARKQHWDARHHCSAFVIGPAGQVRRSSDDGEPSGTAGAPMLEVLTGAGLTDVVAVVTRWFGGTLLGAGGLVRAYGDAVRAALDEAERVTHARRQLLDATDHVADAGRVENALRGAGFDVASVDYAAQAAHSRAVLHVATPAMSVEQLGGLLAEMTGAPADLVERGQAWAPVGA